MTETQKKATLVALILGVSLSLCACSHPANPLTQVSKHDAGVFLANASQYAQKKLKWDRDAYGSGGAYGFCMTQTTHSPNCQTLYKTMLTFAGQNTPYQSLTLSELTDRSTFETLKEEYQGAAFNLLPD